MHCAHSANEISRNEEIIMQDTKLYSAPKHNNKGRFIEACLLCLLKEEQSYGYSLMENLSDFGFVEDEVNISVIYRKLRSMEKNNLVISSWVESEQGPNQRIYKITKQGNKELYVWIEFLTERKKRIDLIVDKYNNIK